MKHIYKMEYTLKPCITHKTNVDATEKKKKICVFLVAVRQTHPL